MSTSVSTADRLCFTAFLAVAFHATLILGVSFELLHESDSSPVIEVTLAHNPRQQTPEKADYMAQADQIGGGELEHKALPSLTQPSEYIAQDIREVSAESPEPAQPQAERQLNAAITSESPAEEKANANQEDEIRVKKLEQVSEEISLLEQSLQIASMDAKLDAREQFRTKRTKAYSANSVSTLKTADAYYVNQWVSKIHRIGSLNYPEEARERKIYGSLRMTVVMLPNGEVQDILIQRSSGSKILDDAAIRIVRLAEPFAPFPTELARDYDLLEITRTWQFLKDGGSPLL